MQIVPVHDYGLLLTQDMAPYFILAAGKKTGHVPTGLASAMDDGTFKTRAFWKNPGCVFEDKTLYSVWRAKEDVEDAFGKDAPSIESVASFEGEAETLPDKDTPVDQEGMYVIEDAVELSFGNRLSGEDIVYMPLDSAPSFYVAAYAKKQDMVKEITDKLAAIGVELPDAERLVAKYLVEISGTVCV